MGEKRETHFEPENDPNASVMEPSEFPPGWTDEDEQSLVEALALHEFLQGEPSSTEPGHLPAITEGNREANPANESVTSFQSLTAAQADQAFLLRAICRVPRTVFGTAALDDAANIRVSGAPPLRDTQSSSAGELVIWGGEEGDAVVLRIRLRPRPDGYGKVPRADISLRLLETGQELLRGEVVLVLREDRFEATLLLSGAVSLAEDLIAEVKLLDDSLPPTP